MERKHYDTPLELAVRRNCSDRWSRMLEDRQFATKLQELRKMAEALDAEIDASMRRGVRLAERWTETKRQDFARASRYRRPEKGMIFQFPSRGHAFRSEDCIRMMRRNPAELKLYPWPLTLFPERWPEGGYDSERSDAKLIQAVAWRAARRFRKRMRLYCVPVEIEVHHNKLYVAVGDVDPLTDAERDWLTECLHDAAKGAVGCYVEYADNRMVLQGNVHPDWDRKRLLAERYRGLG